MMPVAKDSAIEKASTRRSMANVSASGKAPGGGGAAIECPRTDHPSERKTRRTADDGK